MLLGHIATPSSPSRTRACAARCLERVAVALRTSVSALAAPYLEQHGSEITGRR